MTERINDPSIVQLLSVLVPLLSTIFTGVMAYFMAKLKTQADHADVKREDIEKKTDALKVSLDKTEKTGNAVHVLVNSAMEIQLKISMLALKRVAELTKNETDKTAADLAERLLNEHTARQTALDRQQATDSPTTTTIVTTSPLKQP